ncbi:MAG: YkgJ family cysteine cluster protein [Desulfobacterales bacterium]
MDTSKKNDNAADIIPVRLGLDSTFNFHCHKGVDCFTKCCRGINIILTPYDILLLKNRLGLSSEEFLAIYTVPRIWEKTDLPVVTLKLLDDERQSCPFVRESGCIVYEDRPTTCRYYPVGSASLSHKEGVEGGDFYFFVNEPHCLGFNEQKSWTIREWRKDQGVDIHDDINAQWTDLIVRKRSFPSTITLTDKGKELFFMVSYNLDRFRRFVFESAFLTRFNVDEKTAITIKSDEVALLKFGLKWLKDILFQDRHLDAQ